MAVNSVTGIMPIFNLFSMSGMILVEGFLWTPIVFLLMATPFRSMDPSLEEAAVVAGSSDWQVFWKVTLPMAMPSLLSVLILTFIRSMEAFEIPALVGLPAGIEVMTTQIYLQLIEGFVPEYGYASAYSVLLIALVALCLVPYYRVTQHAHRFTTITGKGFPASAQGPGTVALAGRAGFAGPADAPASPAYRADLVELHALPRGAFLGCALHVYPEQLRGSVQRRQDTALHHEQRHHQHGVRHRLRGRGLRHRLAGDADQHQDALASGPVDHGAAGVPGHRHGVAVLQTYLVVPIPVYGTIWILVIAFAARYLPYAMRFSHAGLIGIHKELEESATASGASWGNVARRIMVPLMMPALFAGWIYIFLITIRELSVALLLYSPGSEVISVVIWELWDNGHVGSLSAFALGISVGTVILASLFYKLSRRHGLDVR